MQACGQGERAPDHERREGGGLSASCFSFPACKGSGCLVFTSGSGQGCCPKSGQHGDNQHIALWSHGCVHSKPEVAPRSP